MAHLSPSAGGGTLVPCWPRIKRDSPKGRGPSATLVTRWAFSGGGGLPCGGAPVLVPAPGGHSAQGSASVVQSAARRKRCAGDLPVVEVHQPFGRRGPSGFLRCSRHRTINIYRVPLARRVLFARREILPLLRPLAKFQGFFCVLDKVFTCATNGPRGGRSECRLCHIGDIGAQAANCSYPSFIN